METKVKNILTAIEKIVVSAENSRLSKEFLQTNAPYIKYLSRKLKMTELQSILLALFVDRSEDCRIRLSEIASYLGVRTTRILILSKDIDVLEKMHYLRCNRRGDTLSYCVPSKVLAAFKENKPYEYEETKVGDVQEFFDQMDYLYEQKDDDELTYDELIEQMRYLFDQIKSSRYYRELDERNLCNDDIVLFTFMANLYVKNDDNNINFHDISEIYDNERIPSWCKRELRSRTSDLFKTGLIENTNTEGIGNTEIFKLTNKAKEEVLAELNINRAGEGDKCLIKHDALAEKHLFYNPDEDAQVSELSDILMPERFARVQERLTSAGMRPGFCCLFYGAPGTGKTETVYQLARRTGRHIMRVDVDKIKSCWVGESEKNIKQLFDRYRAICKNSPLAPILLFNEADAVLGVRMEGASKAVDKMENSIQNIILQEMETLPGIMIATTNLTTNLDKAFERRFLYKIRFNKPTLAARTSIWQAMLPGLNEEQATTLAGEFDLSGGEIENIARKHTVNAILSGSEAIEVDAIIQTARHERISTATRTKIGF